MFEKWSDLKVTITMVFALGFAACGGSDPQQPGRPPGGFSGTTGTIPGAVGVSGSGAFGAGAAAAIGGVGTSGRAAPPTTIGAAGTVGALPGAAGRGSTSTAPGIAGSPGGVALAGAPGGPVPPVAGTPGTGMTGTGAAGMGAAVGGAAGAAMPMAPPSMAGACTPAPAGAAISDYGAKGPFDAMEVDNTGPGNQYTMFRPRQLGMNGFLHPPVTWGNGVTTTPALYIPLLQTVASHGFVVIASNSTGVTSQDVRSGLEWLIMQNDGSGDFKGKLAVKCAGSIGYSMGGGAAVGAGAHPNVVATVSMHGLPDAAGNLHGPLLLMTSTNDGFVTKEGFVMPCYNASTKVPTIMATENVPGATPDFAGHLLPLGDSGNERAPLIAWLRLWIYGDQGTRNWFYGADCRLCKTPWTDIQRKNAMWD